MSEVAKMIVGICPGCDTKIRFEEQPRLGQLVTCPECQDTLEVVRRSPLELDWAFEEAFDDEDDWDDEDDFEDWDEEEEEYEDWDDEDWD